MKRAALAGLVFLAMAGPAAADTCPLPSQRPMLIVRLFFGQSEAGRGEIPRRAWQAFLREIVTPRFPNGFTVYDGYGQWRDPATSKIVRERAKVVEIATESAPETLGKIPELTALYRARFHQQSVGVVSMPGCGAF